MDRGYASPLAMQDCVSQRTHCAVDYVCRNWGNKLIVSNKFPKIQSQQPSALLIFQNIRHAIFGAPKSPFSDFSGRVDECSPNFKRTEVINSFDSSTSPAGWVAKIQPARPRVLRPLPPRPESRVS